MEIENPEVFVLAGPNGAGKTTVARLLIPEMLGVKAFVNADFIAQGLSPHAPEASAFAAGRIMLKRLRELRDHRETFAFESALSAKSLAPFLQQARASGYLVHLIYVYLRTQDLAVRRVNLRVERGGHDLPEATIRRRFDRSLENLFRLYIPLSDTWSVYDNSGGMLGQVASGRAGAEPAIMDTSHWARIRHQGKADGTR